MQYDKIDDILKGFVKDHISADELNKELDKIKLGMKDSTFACQYIQSMVNDCQKRLLVDFAIDPEKRSPTKVIMTYFSLMMELGIYIGGKLKPERVFEMPEASNHIIEVDPLTEVSYEKNRCPCPSCVKWREEHEL